MKVSICSRGFPLSEALRHAVEREAREFDHALAGRAGAVSVRLYDVNGTRGGPDMACSAQVRLRGERATVVATDVDANMYTAIAGAFAKLERGARNALERGHSRRRSAVVRASASPSWLA